MKKPRLPCKLSALILSSVMVLCLIPFTTGCNEARRKGSGLSEYGNLFVRGNQLYSENGSPAVLRGLSSHGLLWFPEYTNYAALSTLREYGANVFRVAVYPAQNGGYLEEPELNEKLLYAAIENALAADMYVIVDWHVLQDENPQKHEDEAKQFFKGVARRYGQEPGIIYEICNEPNGGTTYKDIQAYADEVIPVIRKYAPDSIVLVGMPKYCTTLEDAVKNPLPYENVMYTYHFYSDVSDCRYAQSQIGKALDNGIPVFVSEWGYKVESETLSRDTESLDSFMDFLEENKISWVNWALSNKDESYSFIDEGDDLLSGWTTDQLSPSGKYVVDRLDGRELEIFQ